jgi:hypothetical protein
VQTQRVIVEETLHYEVSVEAHTPEAAIAVINGLITAGVWEPPDDFTVVGRRALSTREA